MSPYSLLFLIRQDSLRSQKKTFLFKERKRKLYMVLEALCYIQRIQLEYNVRVTLSLLEAKCLFFLSILDISQLINWFPSGKSSDFSIDSYSFEKILHFSEWKGAAENCEIDSAELPKIVLPVQQTGIEKGAAVSSGKLRDGQRPEFSESSSEKSLSSEAVPESSNPKTDLDQRHQRFQAYLNSSQYAKNFESWSEAIADQLGSRIRKEIEASIAEENGSSVQPAESPAPPVGSPVQSSKSSVQPSVSPVQQKSVHPLKSLVDHASASYGRLDDSAASVCSKLPAADSTAIVYRISNIPVAVSNMLKANEYRLEGFGFVDTRKSKYSDFSNELSTTMLSNIMFHYIHLQEYETDRNLLWQMTRDFADVLDKWFQEKKNKKRFNTETLAKVDYPMLNKTFAFMFMGGCLSFYLMYRLEGNRSYYLNARHFYAMMLLQVKKYDLWESVLKSLAEQAEMRKHFLLDCHKSLRRLPDRCVAVIRSYLHMLPLLYETCIMNKTVGGPTNCPRLQVRDEFFPFNVDAEPRPDTDTDITLKILRRAKVHLRKAHRFDQQGGIITALECVGSSKEHSKDETLQYCEDITVDFVKTVPKYPVLERWSWKKPEGDTRPLCTGDDDCDSAPCNVEEYIDDEEENNVVTFNLDDEPNILKELVTLNTRKKDSSSFSSLPHTLLRVRKSLRKVTKKLLNSLDVFPKTGKDGQDHYVTICIPGLRTAEQSQAVPNHKMEDLSLTLFTTVLKRSIGYLSDDGLPEDLALCKALLCLDSLLNLEFRISQLLRGSIADLEHFL